jgi:hypothetical protein
MWRDYTNAFFGLILLGVAFLNFDEEILRWAIFFLGLAILILSSWDALISKRVGHGPA